MNKQVLSYSVKKWTVSILRAIFLIAFSFILLYPIFFMVSESLKTNQDIINPAVNWISRSPSLYSYKIAFKSLDYLNSLKNTFFFEIISAVLEVFSCAVYAYGLSRFKMKIKPLLIFFLVLIIFVPDIVLIIPRITNFRYMDVFGILGLFNKLTGIDLRLNLTDTVFSFWLPSLFGVGLKGGIFMFIYMQFFKGLPYELEEAAWIDGAGPIKTFIKIIIPSSGVVILTVFIFAIIWHWNDYLLSMMYANNNKTLAVMLYDIENAINRWKNSAGVIIDANLDYGIPLAACVLYILPPTVMYLFLQKNFIQSIDRVGIVG